MSGDERRAGARRRPGPPAWMLRWDRARRPLLLLGGVLVVAALVPALSAEEADRLLGALRVGWVGLLLMVASLWQPARLRRHEAWVTDVRPPMDDADAFDGYAVACCSCGWTGERRSSPEDAFADAGGHAAVVDPTVDRPLG